MKHHYGDEIHEFTDDFEILLSLKSLVQASYLADHIKQGLLDHLDNAIRYAEREKAVRRIEPMEAIATTEIADREPRSYLDSLTNQV